MQWSAGENAGFGDGASWLPVHGNHDRINVETETDNPGSLLNLYRDLIALRNGSDALSRGSWIPIHDGSEGVISYTREFGSEQKLVMLNFVTRPAPGEIPLAVRESLGPLGHLTVEVSTHRKPGETARSPTVTLAPYEATVFTVTTAQERRTNTSPAT